MKALRPSSGHHDDESRDVPDAGPKPADVDGGPWPLVARPTGRDDHGVETVPHRPSEQEMDRRTCLTLLSTKTVGRVVLSGDEPFIVPVNFIMVDDLVVFRSDPSSHAAHGVGTAVAFEVDSIDIGHDAGWSVVVRGMLQDLTGRFEHEPNGPRLQPWAPGDKCRWLAIHPGEVSGRRVQGPLRPQSHHDDRGYL
jgi:hypothetical protein